jgi:hypothetical protein
VTCGDDLDERVSLPISSAMHVSRVVRACPSLVALGNTMLQDAARCREMPHDLHLAYHTRRGEAMGAGARGIWAGAGVRFMIITYSLARSAADSQTHKLTSKLLRKRKLVAHAQCMSRSGGRWVGCGCGGGDGDVACRRVGQRGRRKHVEQTR